MHTNWHPLFTPVSYSVRFFTYAFSRPHSSRRAILTKFPSLLAMRTVREFRTLTGLQILDTPLPEIITREGYRTTSSAYHHLFYNGPLVHWPIETEAHDVVFAEKLNEHHLAVEMPGVANHPCSNTREQYICGDDADVYARFMQNALTPVAAVGFAQGIKTNFGNFRASEEYAEFKNRRRGRRLNQEAGVDESHIFLTLLQFTVLLNVSPVLILLWGRLT